MSKFRPNQLTFDQGLERIAEASKRAGFTVGREIVTSRDPSVLKLRELLKVDNVPDGFSKWQLPVHLDRPSQLFISVAPPNVQVPEHSHDEGDGIRFIMGGSITYNGQELGEGDWMFIPMGAKYSFRVGPTGARFGYCYCCCCA